MAAPRIKKKKAKGGKPTTTMPRQGAIPCLVLVVLALLVVGALFFAAIESTGG